MDSGYDREAADRIVRRVRDDERVSEAVVAAVVEATVGSWERVTEVEPLYDAVDLEALDDLFRGEGGRVVFHHAGCEVVIERGTSVVVTPLV